MPSKFNVVDAHQDLAFSMLSHGRRFDSDSGDFMLTESAWRRGGLKWSWCTLFVHPDYAAAGYLNRAVDAELAIYRKIVARNPGRYRMVESADDLHSLTRSDGAVGISILMEGADPVSEPAALDAFSAAGVRALGLVWHGANKFAAGNYAEGGLTADGCELLRRAAALGMAVDLSHLNRESFWDVVEFRKSKIPELKLYASHSNADAVCPHVRNLDDRQLAAVREAGGAVGVVLFNDYLDPRWERTEFGEFAPVPPETIWEGDPTPEQIAVKLLEPQYTEPKLARSAPEAEPPKREVGLDIVLEHIDHLAYMLGENRVGLGSDFDGGLNRWNTPAPIRDFGDIGILGETVAARKGDAFAAKFMGENWFQFWMEALPQ
jgi:membrane dipeptidase